VYGEEMGEPEFNAIAFYLHVAGYVVVRVVDEIGLLKRACNANGWGNRLSGRIRRGWED
jgi:hypothetical protein